MASPWYPINLAKNTCIVLQSTECLDPFSLDVFRCGKCNRYLKLIESKPTRLHCATCSDTYNIPQNGSVKVHMDYRFVCSVRNQIFDLIRNDLFEIFVASDVRWTILSFVTSHLRRHIFHFVRFATTTHLSKTCRKKTPDAIS